MTHKDLILQQCQKRGIKLQDLAKAINELPSTLSENMRRGKPSYDLLPHTETNNVRCPKCGHEFHVALNAEEK